MEPMVLPSPSTGDLQQPHTSPSGVPGPEKQHSKRWKGSPGWAEGSRDSPAPAVIKLQRPPNQALISQEPAGQAEGGFLGGGQDALDWAASMSLPDSCSFNNHHSYFYPSTLLLSP